MNILVFSVVDYPNGDASSAHAALVVRGLRANGENAFLLIPHASLLGNDAGNERATGHHNGVPFFYMSRKTTRATGVLWATIESLGAMLKASILIARRRLGRRVDAVVLATPDSLEYFPVLCTCLLFRVPIFVWTVEMMTLRLDAWGWRQKLRLAGHNFTEKVLPRLAAGFIVISTPLREYYRQYLPEERLLLSPILVDPEMQSRNQIRVAPNDGKIVLYSGTFGEKDGVEYLLRAFKIVHDRYPESHFILTGKSTNDEIMDRMRDLAKDLGIDAAVSFSGFVTREVLEKHKQQAHVLLVCRSKSSFAQYGLPWKLGEYSLTGKPIVATRAGDIELYFEHEKHLLFAEPEDAKSIADQLMNVFGDYAAALKMAERCKEAALLHFDYRVQIRLLSDFIAHVSRCRTHAERNAHCRDSV